MKNVEKGGENMAKIKKITRNDLLCEYTPKQVRSLTDADLLFIATEVNKRIAKNAPESSWKCIKEVVDQVLAKK